MKLTQQEFSSELTEFKNGWLARPFESKLRQKTPNFTLKSHRVSEMIATEKHIRHLYCGTQALL